MRKTKPKRGRPPADIESRNLTLWLPVELHAELTRQAKSTGLSLNAYVRMMLTASADRFRDHSRLTLKITGENK